MVEGKARVLALQTVRRPGSDLMRETCFNCGLTLKNTWHTIKTYNTFWQRQFEPRPQDEKEEDGIVMFRKYLQTQEGSGMNEATLM